MKNLYKELCELEKRYYEEIYSKDKMIFLKSDQEPEKKYSSYKDLFEDQYKDSFNQHLKDLGLNRLSQNIGVTSDSLQKAIKDSELDIDNDGTPDRIDIDSQRNSVQTVSDLNIVGNSYIKDFERVRDREENERER